MRRWLSRLSAMGAENSGIAAVEFAFVAPLLVAMVLGISQVTEILVGSTRMQAAARASVQYVLNGGQDLTTAQQVGMQSWERPPSDASLVASDYCICDGAVAVCTQTCSDGDIPAMYVSVKATGSLGGTVYYQKKQVTEVARIR